MAGSVLVDTTVVIAYFRGDASLRSRFIEFAPLHSPWVVLGELHFGARRARRQQEQLENIRNLLTYSMPLFPDQHTTEHYADIKSELAQIGKPISDNDLWIAAVARQHDLPLATRDAHFGAVAGLKTVAW